jgi:hypothetical protein
MKIKDKEFIREIISSDFKHISNPYFTRNALEKIAEFEDNKITYSNSGDMTLLIPVIVYVSLFILLSLITEIISWPLFGQLNNVMHSIEMISSFLVHPVTISILLSFSLLYLIDLYLNKGSAYFTKPKVV